MSYKFTTLEKIYIKENSKSEFLSPTKPGGLGIPGFWNWGFWDWELGMLGFRMLGLGIFALFMDVRVKPSGGRLAITDQ